MIASLIVIISFLAGSLLTLYLVLRRPVIDIRLSRREIRFSSYFAGAMLAPILLLIFGLIDPSQVVGAIRGHAHLNPAGILLLFFSMVFMSIYLDTTGFFEYCARNALKYAGTSGVRVFVALYAIVSALTIFTSNDIIILTLTPFIYYFTKNAGVDPKPFLLTEFFAANTWSIMLYIGNPTNIVIASAFSLRFDEYTKYMLLPTAAAGLTNLLLLYLLFRKRLEAPLKAACTGDPASVLADRGGALLGLALLSGCIVGLAIAPYIGIEMWQVSVSFTLLLIGLIALRDVSLRGFLPGVRESSRSELRTTIYRLPLSIAPYVLSLFVTVEALRIYEVTSAVGALLSGLCGSSLLASTVLYGFTSAFAANALNNIPMTIAYVPVIEGLEGRVLLAAAFATTIGSNLGANLTPLGSLAGIMWMNILDAKECRVTFREFVVHGLLVTPITLMATLFTLWLEFAF